MDRISTATKAVDLFGAGKSGFKDGDLALGITPTDLDADWFNGVQEELLAIIEGAGLVANAATRNQVRTAINRMAGGNIKTITSANSPYALTADDAGVLLIDATAGNAIVNMPPAAGVKAVPFVLRRVDTAANTVTINRAGADTLDGATSAPLVGKGQWVHYRSDGVTTFQAYGASSGLTRFTSNGSFTVPAGKTTIYVSGCAGGGGGGPGGSGTSQIAAGGSGGGAGQSIVRVPFAVVPGQVIAITIGAGGASNGNGGNTVIGALQTLTAGFHGNVGFNVASPVPGNDGGAGFPAGGQASDETQNTGGAMGGTGASGPFGGGGAGARCGTASGAAAGNAAGFGAGGGGGGGYYTPGVGNGTAGGTGAPGLVIIEW